MLKIGDHILHYELVASLGQGGMGQVFKALDHQLERYVALKFLLNQNLHNIEWLKHEAKALARLDHPNIGTIHAIEQRDDNIFLVMPYYEGQNLQDALISEPLSRAKSLDIFRQVVKGVNYAHKYQVVHRDLKPANIFINNENIVKILDFGIAYFLDANISLKGEIIGTINYTSPEQLRGEAVDTRGDIWSLGVILFELLTGTLPFKGKFPQVMTSILHEEPRRLGKYLEHQGLEHIISTCLAKDKEGRFENCEALLACLEQLEFSESFMPLHLNPLVRKRSDNSTRTRGRRRTIVGRMQELDDISQLLQEDSTCLLTLTGIGGVGKTTLAQEIYESAEMLSHYPEGRYFVSLDGVQHRDQLPLELARALGFNLSLSSSSPWSDIYEHFSTQPMLLVLDNLEHIMPVASEAIDNLLNACPQLTILATSREVLNLEGETIYELKGLRLPEPSLVIAQQAQNWQNYDATALFIAKARRLKRNFEPEREKESIVELCHKLEGWPLGIELAAAWVRQLSVQEIAEKIQENIDILATRMRKAKPRHQSARATFTYSWQLLQAQEQDVLVQLAIFQDGFTTEAACQVAATNLQVLASLVDKSLLRITEAGRYDSHILIYDFCYEKLLQRHDKDALAARHAQYFCDLAREAHPYLHSKEQLLWLKRIEAERANIQATLVWCQEAGKPVQGLELLSNIFTFLYVHNHLQYTIDWLRTLRAALPAQEHLHLRARSFHYEGDLVWQLGFHDEASLLYQQSLELHQKNDDKLEVAHLYLVQGSIKRLQQDYETAQRLIAKSHQLFEDYGKPYHKMRAQGQLALLAHNLGNNEKAVQILEKSLEHAETIAHPQAVGLFHAFLGVIRCHQYDYQGARQNFEQALHLLQEVGERRGEAIVLAHLGWLHALQEDNARASQFYLSSLELLAQKATRDVTAFVLSDIASFFYHHSYWDTASQLFAAADTIAAGQPIYVIERAINMADYVPDLEMSLGKDFQPLWQEGQKLTSQQAIHKASQQLENTFAPLHYNSRR